MVFTVDAYCQMQKLKSLKLTKKKLFFGLPGLKKKSKRESSNNVVTASSKGHRLGGNDGALDEWPPGRLFLVEKGVE